MEGWYTVLTDVIEFHYIKVNLRQLLDDIVTITIMFIKKLKIMMNSNMSPIYDIQ